MNKISSILLSFVLLYSTSCQNDNEKITVDNITVDNIMEKSESIYFKDSHDIYYREILQQDIKTKVGFNVTNNFNDWDLYCQLEFFNYGDDIILQNKMRKNIFTPFIGKIYAIEIIKNNSQIEITKEIRSEQYGECALGNIRLNDMIIRDVFITPLAYYYNRHSNECDLILVGFCVGDQFMNVVFKGSNDESIIAIKNRTKILTNPGFPHSNSDDNMGAFWYKNS